MTSTNDLAAAPDSGGHDDPTTGRDTALDDRGGASDPGPQARDLGLVLRRGRGGGGHRGHRAGRC